MKESFRLARNKYIYDSSASPTLLLNFTWPRTNYRRPLTKTSNHWLLIDRTQTLFCRLLCVALCMQTWSHAATTNRNGTAIVNGVRCPSSTLPQRVNRRPSSTNDDRRCPSSTLRQRINRRPSSTNNDRRLRLKSSTNRRRPSSTNDDRQHHPKDLGPRDLGPRTSIESSANQRHSSTSVRQPSSSTVQRSPDENSCWHF